ncbi:hypothetical protein C095_07625 [Fusobacterium necrophorum subsp. funduliforme B35]|uniref:Uncharacterized protein n=1 Tax=Fusobacterium necrophorum subsp. funduliforme B35 TaxID=1226633 RepID=A0A0B4EPP6_9FUSO|nr:hypothetical protein C095_07625 [Fusobacterium necrophorum subsp. funduliforme B35]
MFRLCAKYQPTGDQPIAIEKLVESLEKKTEIRSYWE